MRLELRRYEGVDAFLADAGGFLAAREAEHNLILGLCSGLRRYPGLSEGPPFLAAVTGEAGVVGAALRTPPANLVLSEIDDPAAVPLLTDAAGEDLPGVSGPPDAARACAERWAARTGGRWRVGLQERIYRLVTLRPPRPAAGDWRLALARDRELIAAWLVAFRGEALAEPEADGVVRRRIDDWAAGASGRRFWLWEDGGVAVSLVGASGETPNGIRVGPVYTPPEHRGRGYATNLTAAVSGAVLAEGRRFCFLYTDLANPTSNRIYQAIGYEPVTDALLLSFTGPSTQTGRPPESGGRPT